MSNKRKVKPGDRASRFAAAYRCSDCVGATTRVIGLAEGVYCIEIFHNDACPVPRGRVDGRADVVGALQAAGDGTGLLMRWPFGGVA